MPKKAKKVPRKCRPTVEERIDAARISGKCIGVQEEYERANSRGVAYAVKLNNELQKVQGCLATLQENAAKTANLLAEVIRENTPKPRV